VVPAVTKGKVHKVRSSGFYSGEVANGHCREPCITLVGSILGRESSSYGDCLTEGIGVRDIALSRLTVDLLSDSSTIAGIFTKYLQWVVEAMEYSRGDCGVQY